MFDDIRETTRKEKYRAYQQGRSDALNIDMDEPMHFTDEQKAWIKKYIIINAERQRADAIKEYRNKLFDKFIIYDAKHGYPCVADIKEILDDTAEQLKEQNQN